MLEVINAVVTALQAAGYTAAAALPAEEYENPASAQVAVGLEKACRSPASYLGPDASGLERYGQTVSARLYADIYSPLSQGGSACTQTADGVCQTLLEGVPGLTVTQVEAGRCRYDRDADCFVETVTMEAAGYVYATLNETSGLFQDFSLKGNLQ